MPITGGSKYEVIYMKEYNNKEFCAMIIGRLKETGVYAFDILDYALADDLKIRCIKDGYFTFETEFGGSEGVYTDICLKYTSDYVKDVKQRVFTFKTLNESWSDHEKMAVLGSAFVCRANQEILSYY